MSKPNWFNNLEWLTEQLRIVDGIRYEDLEVKRINGRAPYIKSYKGVVYDISDPVQAVKLYEAITGKPQKIMNLDDYIAERRKEHEYLFLGTK